MGQVDAAKSYPHVMSFFSDREFGERPRDAETLSPEAWNGIRAEISARVSDGSFGATYPKTCEDGGGPVGTDDDAFWDAMKARIPDLEDAPWWNTAQVPALHAVMDTIEFCWSAVGKPFRRGPEHTYFRHYHLDYQVEAGRSDFRQAINLIFARNGLAFELRDGGVVVRLAGAVIREAIAPRFFATGDAQLDDMLETARRKFLDPDEMVRREALEKLWDAFERIKTVGAGADKAAKAEAMLDSMCGPTSPKFREAMSAEARALTSIGNGLQIRHSETTQERLVWSEHVDYLFHRMFAFLQFAVRTIRG
jgi:hypothetical protein